MTRMHLAALLLALAVTTGVPAQEEPSNQAEPQSQPQQEETQRQTAGESSKSDKEQLPDIDVWEDSGKSDEDVFIPSESISADSSIAFPSDI